MDKTVLSKEEVERLSQLQQQQNDLVFQLGQVEFQQNFLEKSKKEIYPSIFALPSTSNLI